MSTRAFIGTLIFFTAGLFFPDTGLFAQGSATVTVAANTVVMQAPVKLLGITLDARTGMTGYAGPVGYFNQNFGMLPQIAPLFSDFPISTVRYPANAVMYPFEWKKSVGARPRPGQNILGSLGSVQSMDFGFDEFMSMLLQRGVNPADVQIMLGIYDSSIAWPKLAQRTAAIPQAAQSAADWVEYCNAPLDSLNRGGGRNWAQQRTDNGRLAPYGVKIWNLGNEPWGPGEFGNDAAGANSYLAVVSPIIDSMRSRDSTIRITLPATGPVNSAWNTAMRAFARSRPGIYGLSPHFFPSEDTVAGGGLPYGLHAIAPALKAIADSAAANGLKVIVGDFAHKIKTNPDGTPAEDPDIAVQWKGANLAAEFLVMMSQINNIERADFWTYGLPKAQWHPIRYDGPGSYTLMPVAVLYKLLSPLFLQNSVSVTTVSPQASDGNPYSIRATAFANNDASAVNLIAVNRDKTRGYAVSVNGLAGYSPSAAKLLTGASAAADSITITTILPGPAVFSLPPYGILLVEYTRTASATERLPAMKKDIALYPNPARGDAYLSAPATLLRVYSVVGELIYASEGDVRSIPAASFAPGVYVAVIDGAVRKLVIMR